MDTQEIVQQLRAERDRIDLAIGALEGSTNRAATGRTGAVRRKMRGGITAAGRRKLSQMMKARWAARRKATAKRTTPTKPASTGKKK